MSIQDDLLHVVVQALAKKGVEVEGIRLEVPPDPAMGDLALPCFSFAKNMKMSPQDIAQSLTKEKELQNAAFVRAVEATGPYVNFRFRREAVAHKILNLVLASAKRKDARYGDGSSLRGKHMLIEYVQPNTNKPLHLGHVRNGLLGITLVHLLESQGAMVTKVNIVNDRGIHIAKSMLAYQKWGNGETPDSTGEKGDHFVGRYYVRFEQELQKERQQWLAGRSMPADDQEQEALERSFLASSVLMAEAQNVLRDWEAGDKDIRALWATMNSWVLKGFAETYAQLGIGFDKEYLESNIYQGGRDLITAAVAQGVFRKDPDGSVVAPLKERFGLPDKVLLRKDGTSLYITQDINLAHLKYEEFHPDESLYVVASEQDLYFQQLFAVLQLMGSPRADHIHHLSYGMVNLPEGKMKSREGRVVDADDLLAELVTLATKEVVNRYTDLSASEQEHRARTIALAGLKFHFLLVGKDSAMIYDPKASIAFEGKTGPYLQYTYARAQSILRKIKALPAVPDVPEIQNDDEWLVLLGILRFPDAVAQAAQEYDPGVLANHLMSLAQAFNTFYHDQPVLKAPEPLRSSRLALVAAVATVLKNGLGLMGIETLEVM